MSIITLLVVLLALGLLFGGYGSTRGDWGYWGWSPVGFLVVVFLILWLTGALH